MSDRQAVLFAPGPDRPGSSRPKQPVYSLNDYRPPQAIAALLALCFPPGATVADVTFGRGGFWSRSLPGLRFDRRPLPRVQALADFRALPLSAGAVDVVVYDPPFQPRNQQQPCGKMATRFTTGGCRTAAEIRQLVVAGALECRRVARLGLLVKCQDYINGRMPSWMSLWLYEALGEPFEAMHCRNPAGKILSPLWLRQKSVWRNHASYYVWKTSGATWR